MLRLYHKISCKRLLVIYRAKSTRNEALEISNNLRAMPLEKRHQIQARMGYEARKKNNIKYQTGNIVRIEVVGSGAHGAPRSVHLCIDSVRYLFNCGEGTQRLANEYKIKLTKIPHVFITYPSWENVSGLLGMALSLQTIGIPEFCLHGPKLVESVFSATNKFVALRTIAIKMEDCNPREDFDDGALNIKYVPLYPSQNSGLNQKLSDSRLPKVDSSNSHANHFLPKSEVIHHDDDNDDDDDVDYYEHLTRGKNSKNHHTKKKKPRSQSVECSSKRIKNEKFSMAYICRTKDTLGTLIIEKCVDLGITPGPLLGKLKNGEDITLENGTVVKSSDVKMPDVPGAVIIVVECPTEDYLDSLLKEPAFCKHQSGDSHDLASSVVHFTNSAIVENPKYKEWINRFPKDTKHLFINENNKCLGSVGVQRLQHKLNILHEEIFPLLPNSGIPEFPRNLTSSVPLNHSVVHVEKEHEDNFDNLCLPIFNEVENIYKDKVYFSCEDKPFIEGETLCELYIKPKYKYDYSRSLILKKQHFLNEVFSIEGFQEELNKLKCELQSMKLTNEYYPRILFLGTGSSQPNKLRNTSGILVFLDEKNYILLDCGESTYNQFVQFFGKERVKELLRNLNVIYVSHLHADHHIGLITILKQRKLAFDEKCELDRKNNLKPAEFQPVHLLAPIQLSRWLNLFDQEFESITHLFNILPNASLIDHVFYKNKYEECLNCVNLKEIKTTLVDHCPNAFGVALTHNDGWKLTYSGDTRPCRALVKLGENSDVLIHEATMDDSLEAVASSKLHSTSSQAIQIGKEMNARFILLTHFSQRYSHIPLFNENFTEEVGVAFDNMMVSLNQLPILAKLQNALRLMFTAQYEEMEDKRDYKLLKRKMKNAMSDQPPSKLRNLRSN